MSSYTLLLRLTAPLQSWGLESKFDIRRSGREPTKSGVVGLAAAAMGIRRNDDEGLAQLASLRFGVRVDREGQMLRDFHMARSEKTSYVTYRYYLSDASFVAGLESDDLAYLQEIQEAFSHPVFPLYLGRRSCPPVGRVCMGIVNGTLEQALKENAPDGVRYVFETLPGERGALLKDQPVSFSPEHRKYTFRQIREEIAAGKSLSAEHDPMAELG